MSSARTAARALSESASRRAFLGVSVLLFAASVTLTIVRGTSMSAMGEMAMPGGWTVSMTWTRVPGQTWPGAAASFLGMWIVMMAAMMLPSLIPALWRYRQAIGGVGRARLGRLTALVGLGYFLVWTLVALAVYPLGVALVAVEMHVPALARAVPIAAAVVVLVAGLSQFTRWKAHHLARWRRTPAGERKLPADKGSALRQGIGLGLHCTYCCSGLMAILLVTGIMDLRAMAAATVAMTVEYLAPDGARAARVVGVVAFAGGFFLIAHSFGTG